MEMFGPLLGILGAIPGAQAQQMATMIQWQALQNAKRDADRQFRVSTAGRTDAYGNVQAFDELRNRWELELTPTQNKLIKAGEAEQLRSLTEDAPRNRLIREMAAQRGKDAKKDYTTALAGFRYDQPQSEAAIRDELTGLLAGSKALGVKEAQGNAVRTALRQGKGSQIEDIIKSFSDRLGQETGDVLLQARQGAAQESAARQQQHQSKYLPLLAQLEQTMMQGGDMPVRFSDTPKDMMGVQGQQASGLLSALQSGSQLEQNAYNSLAKQMAQNGVDLKGVASMMAGFGKGQSRNPVTQKSVLPTGSFKDNDFGFGGGNDWYNRTYDFQAPFF